jgi:predicted O-linked N-acetylglucosamine transferase (SPINDLY family)
VTEEVRRFSETFHHFSAAGDLMPVEAIAASIRAANLHALVYLDIGMDPLMTQLAALRLAPIQCMAWDHPVTSGLPSIDYAFSGALSEPGLPEAASHYSEQLALLPGAGVSYRKPLIPFPLLLKTRRDFQLREDAVVYLCCQSAFKFLPQNDHVYTEIAARVPAAQFAFIVANEPVGRDFKSRLDRAFRAAGLRAADHCVFLPQLNHLDYWNLNRVGDVFLDTIEWSSAGSVYEAIACGIPVVALPGRLMRSRQAFAILTQLGVTDTIAGDKATFVDVAVRLATDRGFRLDVVAGMRRGEASLFSDSRSVTALEDFFATLTAPR